MQRFTLVAVVCSLMLVAAASALAQTYPERPVRLIVPFPPIGAVDVVGRVVAARLP